ncbi:MAG: hypothetical protein QOI46_4235, partial [Alphaproteobacteria bacterium]|nr:hypothetical protein [Alphaproteobacteria bacterium]
MSSDGQVAVVTGASQGMGLMIARGLVQRGATVYAGSRSAERLAPVLDELNAAGPGTCRPLVADLGSQEGCRRAADQLASELASLDVL